MEGTPKVTTTTTSLTRLDGAAAATHAPPDATDAHAVLERGAPPEAAQQHRHRYRIRFSVSGRIRFLSHLEMVDTLVQAFRRAGVEIALSQGFRPKPRVRMAMPRPVGVEAWNEIMEVELAAGIDPDEFAFRLQPTLPLGVTLHGIDAITHEEANATRRVRGAVFRLVLSAPVDADAVCAAAKMVRAADTVPIERRTPKQHKIVNVRTFVEDIAATPTDDGVMVRYFARLTEEGSVRPDEVVRALSLHGAGDLPAPYVIREQITIAHDNDGIVAAPELVGADVPDGPEKPWGAC